MLRTMSAVLPSCRICSLTRTRWPSSGSMSVAIQGPAGRTCRSLCPPPLPVDSLQIAGRHVVGAGVAEDDFRHPVLRHVLAQPADHHREFGLVPTCRDCSGSRITDSGPMTAVDGEEDHRLGGTSPPISRA